jgi:hypothetical protein
MFLYRLFKTKNKNKTKTKTKDKNRRKGIDKQDPYYKNFEYYYRREKEEDLNTEFLIEELIELLIGKKGFLFCALGVTANALNESRTAPYGAVVGILDEHYEDIYPLLIKKFPKLEYVYIPIYIERL